MISYSRNLEDVILQRVLADVEKGCYVDVGASHPVVDNNTYAFYEKGWRGIGVDALDYGPLWVERRVEDVFVNAAVGASDGQVTFHIFQETPQISTGSRASLQSWRDDGRVPDQAVTVAMLTLEGLLEQHVEGRLVHLLSIDVEGMEKEVLEGIDLRKRRPWVVVLEATRPGTPISEHEGWEPLLLEADYRMAYADGLNRFYLASEQDALRPRFALPPNVFDEFVRASELELQKKCEALEAEVGRLNDRLKALGAK